MKSDLYEIMQNCVDGTLPNANVEFLEDQHSVAVVLASEGYPGSYKKGLEITGLSYVFFKRDRLWLAQKRKSKHQKCDRFVDLMALYLVQS